MKIIADKNTNAIIIKALPSDYQVIKSIIETLDATPQQVLIEAVIAEVKLADALSNGIEYFFRNGDLNEGGNISLLPSGIGSGTDMLAGGTKFFSMGHHNLDVIISFLAGESELEILSSPHILVRDEQTASIQVGSSEPIRSGSTTGSGGVTTAQIQYRDTGTILTVTPRIGENGMVTLDVRQELSDAVPAEEASIGSPAFTTRVTETSLVVKSGHVIYLGGIIQTKYENTSRKVPLLGDIPFLGNLFRSNEMSTSKTEVMVLITPHITSDATDADVMTREFKNRLKKVSELSKKVQ